MLTLTVSLEPTTSGGSAAPAVSPALDLHLRAAQADAAAMRRPPVNSWSAVVFIVIAVLAALDAVADIRQGLPVWSVLVEVALTGGALGAAALFSWRYKGLRRHANVLMRDLHAAAIEAERWRREAAQVLPALGTAIGSQFVRWGLTPDEHQIALLVLNGLSANEIAELRHSSTAVVRQQMASIYHKAGLSGRAALSAFFLEDLLRLAGHGLARPEQGARPAPAGMKKPSLWN